MSSFTRTPGHQQQKCTSITTQIAILRLIKEKLKGREHYEFIRSVEKAM